jgi:tetratricopeptide (TPR) repeat protein
MSLLIDIIIFLTVGIGFLVFFIIKKIIIPKRAEQSGNLADRNETLKAIRAAKAVLEKDPQNAEAHYLLGKAFLADKRDEQAFREYKSANRLGIGGKNIPETVFRETLAALCAQFNEPEEALKEYIALIKLFPENPEYYFRAGKIFGTRNRSDLAEQYIRKAVSINPREVRYRFELGMLYYLGKRLKEAGQEFGAVLKQNPSDPQALLYMGKILKDAKDYDGAIPYLEKASRDQDYKLRAVIELGSCYISQKMYDKALPELERAVNLITKEADPDSLYARYYLAMCYEMTDDIQKALVQWDKIYAQKKNFRDVGAKLTQYIEFRNQTAEKDPAAPPDPNKKA